MININKSILSIPPYISTQWHQISTLSFDEASTTLIVTLINGTSVSIPNLEKSIIDKIFTMHAEHLQTTQQSDSPPNNPQANIQIPFDMSSMQLPGLESFSNIMSHDPAGADSPDLPPEVLDKVKVMRNALNLESSAFNMPEPVADCNCFHCQVNRALQGTPKEQPPTEEKIDESELTFKEWDIKNVGPDLFNVSNPLDKKEQYQVYLGKENMGCTCGEKDCPHLIAVLKSDV
jgi:hypothetical protein